MDRRTFVRSSALAGAALTLADADAAIAEQELPVPAAIKALKPMTAGIKPITDEERRARIVGKSSITVRVSDLSVSVNGDRAVARFRQAYSADSLNVTSRKTLEFQKSGERWLIVRESTGA